MVVPFKLDDEPAAGEGSGQAEDDLYRLAAAGSEGDPLGAGDELLDQLGHLVFEGMLGAVYMRTVGLLPHCGHKAGMAMAQNQRAPGESVVDVLIAVDVGDSAACSVCKKQWHRRFGAKRTADAAGERLTGALQEGTRLAPDVCGFGHGLDNSTQGAPKV